VSRGVKIADASEFKCPYCLYLRPAGAIRCSNKHEIWHCSPLPVPNFTFIGQKCGNTAPKSVKILNFGHKFTPQGRVVCNIFIEILSVCTSPLASKFLVWSLSGDKQPRSGTYPEIWIRRKGRGVVSSLHSSSRSLPSPPPPLRAEPHPKLNLVHFSLKI